MKPGIFSTTIAILCLLSSGCVNRTITEEPGIRGTSTGKTRYGTAPSGKVVEEKRVWIWQDEFRNP